MKFPVLAKVGAIAFPRGGLRSPRALVALFVALVATILGVVPGWAICSACWLIFGWFVLGCIVAASLALVIATLVVRDWQTFRFEARQALIVALAMLAMIPLHDLNGWSDLVVSASTLRARADASARAGGPRLAMTVDSSEGWNARAGLVYDPEGIIAPRFRQAVAWHDDPVVTALSGECIVERPLIGAWYHWSDDCDAM